MYSYFFELIRPWKLFTFLLGMVVLCYGAFTLNFPDWDIPISIIMASLTYLTAPWVINTLVFNVKNRNPLSLLYIPLALLIAFLVIDSSYVVYNIYFHHPYFRKENFVVSFCLYFICGLIWRYNGNLKQLFKLI